MEQGAQPSFNVVTTSKSTKGGKRGLIIGTAIVAFLAISIAAGVYLVGQQQDIREKAESALTCPSVEACPVTGQPTLLKSCYATASGGAAREISCSTIASVGTTAFCGSSRFCCPSLGASWTTDMGLCSTTSPTPTLTATPTASATSSATPRLTATSSARPTATATGSAVPIPVTGTNWPTLVGAGLGILVIVGSILLVF
jgi:hypothetical protein